MAFAPIALAVAVGLLAGLVRRGRLRAVARAQLHYWIVFGFAVAVGIVVDQIEIDRPGLWAGVGLAAALVFTVRNLHLAGTAVIAIGIMGNLAPVVLNGATPVRLAALADAGMVDSGDLDRVVLNGPRIVADESTRLEGLGDIIPVGFADQVMSFGDLIILAGLASVIANLMLQRAPRRVPASALPSLEAFGWIESTEGRDTVIELGTDLRSLDEPGPDPRERQLVSALSSSRASPVQD